MVKTFGKDLFLSTFIFSEDFTITLLSIDLEVLMMAILLEKIRVSLTEIKKSIGDNKNYYSFIKD